MTVYELIQQLTRYDAGTDVKIFAFTNPCKDTGLGQQFDMYVKSIHGPATEGGPAYIRLEEVNS